MSSCALKQDESSASRPTSLGLELKHTGEPRSPLFFSCAVYPGDLFKLFL